MFRSNRSIVAEAMHVLLAWRLESTYTEQNMDRWRCVLSWWIWNWQQGGWLHPCCWVFDGLPA